MDFLTEHPDLLNNLEGTNDQPLHIGWCASGNGLGWKHFSKIGNIFYAAYFLRKGTKYCTLRCKDYRNGCHWFGRIKPLVSEKDTEYYNRENWKMLSTDKTHTCPGIPKSQISKLQFRNFIKDKIKDGIRDLSLIRELSGIDAKFDMYSATLIGDGNRPWRRCITESKIKQLGPFPERSNLPNMTKIKLFNERTCKTVEEQFYHKVNGHEYFFIPSLLPLMADNIFGDGTFHKIENIANAQQLYTLNVKLYLDDSRKSYFHSILTVKLSDATTTSYTAMWNDIKQFYRTYVGEELNPSVMHLNNEEAFIQATTSAFPSTRIVTSFLHVKEKIKNHLEKAGLGASVFVEEQKKMIFGLLFCNLLDGRQLEMAHEILQLIKFEAQFNLVGDQLVKFVQFIDHYLMKVWFNPNSVYFATKISNIFEDIQTESNTSLHKKLKSGSNKGYISKFDLKKILLAFYTEKHNQLLTFRTHQKTKNSNSTDLANAAKMKKLTTFLAVAMDLKEVDKQFLKQMFFEVAFKFGNILNPNVNDLYISTFPNYLPVIEL